jgi:hypothetical protein
MSLDVPNGGAFLFLRTFDTAGKPVFTQQLLPDHVLPKTATLITPPPAAPPPPWLAEADPSEAKLLAWA